MNEFSQLTFKAGDLVKVEGTYDSAMPTSMIGILIDRANDAIAAEAGRHRRALRSAGKIWNVQFTNGVILKIWQGHLINLREETSA